MLDRIPVEFQSAAVLDDLVVEGNLGSLRGHPRQLTEGLQHMSVEDLSQPQQTREYDSGT